jgi:hypothetical protein
MKKPEVKNLVRLGENPEMQNFDKTIWTNSEIPNSIFVHLKSVVARQH